MIRKFGVAAVLVVISLLIMSSAALAGQVSPERQAEIQEAMHQYLWPDIPFNTTHQDLQQPSNLSKKTFNLSSTGNEHVSLEAPNEVPIGTEFTVEIYIENVSDLYGAQIDLSFDSAIVQVVYAGGTPSSGSGAVVPGTLFAGQAVDTSQFVNTFDNTTGKVTFANFLLGEVPGVSVTGPTLFATITFKAIALGYEYFQPSMQMLDSKVMDINWSMDWTNPYVTVRLEPYPVTYSATERTPLTVYGSGFDQSVQVAVYKDDSWGPTPEQVSDVQATVNASEILLSLPPGLAVGDYELSIIKAVYQTNTWFKVRPAGIYVDYAMYDIVLPAGYANNGIAYNDGSVDVYNVAFQPRFEVSFSPFDGGTLQGPFTVSAAAYQDEYKNNYYKVAIPLPVNPGLAQGKYDVQLMVYNGTQLVKTFDWIGTVIVGDPYLWEVSPWVLPANAAEFNMSAYSGNVSLTDLATAQLIVAPYGNPASPVAVSRNLWADQQTPQYWGGFFSADMTKVADFGAGDYEVYLISNGRYSMPYDVKVVGEPILTEKLYPPVMKAGVSSFDVKIEGYNLLPNYSYTAVLKGHYYDSPAILATSDSATVTNSSSGSDVLNLHMSAPVGQTIPGYYYKLYVEAYDGASQKQVYYPNPWDNGLYLSFTSDLEFYDLDTRSVEAGVYGQRLKVLGWNLAKDALGNPVSYALDIARADGTVVQSVYGVVSQTDAAGTEYVEIELPELASGMYKVVFHDDSLNGGFNPYFFASSGPAPLVIATTDVLPDATISQSYNKILAATGGVSPYTWSLAVGSSLPAGLSLNTSTGAISGTPSVLGAFTFTVQVTDSTSPVSNSVQKLLSLTVKPAPLAILTTGLSNATIEQAYTQTLEAGGGVAPYKWAIETGSSLPAGLNLSEGGIISGTPGQSGEFTFTVRLTDSASPSSSVVKNFTLQVYGNGVVRISPASKVALLGNDFTVDVALEKIGTLLGGVQAHIAYDKSILRFVSAAGGPATGNPPLTPIIQETSNGLECAVFLTNGEIASDGVVFTLTFSAIAEGTSSLIFTAGGTTGDNGVALLDAGNKQVSPLGYTVTGGSVQVVTGSSVEGYVKLDSHSKNDNSGVLITVTDGTHSYTGQSLSSGYFIISGVPVGTYTISFDKDGYLKRTVSAVSVNSNKIIGSLDTPVSLWPGDTNKDGKINVFDVGPIRAAFFSIYDPNNSTSKYNVLADLNRDGKINVFDVGPLRTHFFTTSSSYPVIIINY